MCGGPVADRTGLPGRRTTWCSKACRQRAWRARTAADRAECAAADLSDRIAGGGYGDVQDAARALGQAVIAMCDPGDVGALEDALMSGHRWEGDVAGAARRLAAAATRVAELADAHAAHVADYRRARAVVRRAPASRGRDDESPGGIVANTAAKASATNHGDTPAADTIDADDLFDAVEDVLTDVRDAPGVPQDVLQDVPGVPGPSFADALEALAAAHAAASGDGPHDELAAAAAAVVRARPPYLPARADAAVKRLQEVVTGP
ncbi:hypothetical protein ACQEU6_46185 [Spirillospora sp. CA-108201]